MRELEDGGFAPLHQPELRGDRDIICHQQAQAKLVERGETSHQFTHETGMRLGAFAAAERDFQSLLAIAPETLPVQRDLASAYLRQGKIDAAQPQSRAPP